MKKSKAIRTRLISLVLAVLLAVSIAIPAFSSCGSSDTSSSAKANTEETNTDESKKAYEDGGLNYRNGYFEEAIEEYKKVSEDSNYYEDAQAYIKYSECVLAVNEQKTVEDVIDTIYTQIGAKYGEDDEADSLYNLYTEEFEEAFLKAYNAYKKDSSKLNKAQKLAKLATDAGLVSDNIKKQVKELTK